MKQKNTYDAQGRRTSKTVNGVTTTYTYSGNLLMQLSKAGKTLQFVYDAGGTALGFKAKETGAMYYYIRNLQGDVTRIADEEGVAVTSYTYDPWGFMTISGGNAYLALNPFRYRGYYYDNETGLYFLQTRFYDPAVKRFLNADSLFIAGDEVTGANMYAYCNGNPVMYSDPSGRITQEWVNNMMYFFSLIRSIMSSLNNLKEWITLTGVIYGEEHGTYYEDGVESDVEWRRGQYAIATIIWNAYKNTTLNDFKDKNTLYDVISARGAFSTFGRAFDLVKSLKFQEIDKMVNAGILAAKMVMGAFSPMSGMENIYQNRDIAYFNQRCPEWDRETRTGVYTDSDGKKHNIFGIVQIGGNYFFGGYND